MSVENFIGYTWGNSEYGKAVQRIFTLITERIIELEKRVKE